MAINKGISDKGLQQHLLLDKEGNKRFGVKIKGKSGVETRFFLSHPEDILSEKAVAQSKHTGEFQVLKESDFIEHQRGNK